MPSASPAQAYIEPSIRNEEYIDVSVGDQIVKVVFIGAASIVGATALSEAKDALVTTLTNTFGKYKDTQPDDNILCIKNVPENDFEDVIPDAKKLDFQEANDGDAAAASFTDKQAKFEALSSNQNKTEKDTQQKKASMETIMETQRMEYEKFTNEVLDKQQESFKQLHAEDMKKMEDKR